ncbi:polymorphic toxin type 50 domain-containing protein [Chlamydiales bacterium]|nr:polymorphic toxin type 50 domain-containing protein [Chlamydiales bacterium]
MACIRTIKIIYIFLLMSFVISDKIYSGYDDGVSTYYYSGLPGCGCFDHCSCFSHYLGDPKEGGFLNGVHPDSYWIENKIYHEFMIRFILAIKKGPYFPCDWVTMRKMVSTSSPCSLPCLISDYLNKIEVLSIKLESAKSDLIDFYIDLYKKPNEKDKLTKELNRLATCTDVSQNILKDIPHVIIPMYKELMESCSHQKDYNMAFFYNKGLLSILEGNCNEALEDILRFINLAEKNDNEMLLTSEVFQKEGEAFLEVGLYNDAIIALNRAISKDPKNMEAYFQRASAYFEIGDFERSLNDYVFSKKNKSHKVQDSISIEFVEAFYKASIDGAFDAASEFLPSLCHTAYGLGTCLWAFGEHPVESIQNLAYAGYEICEPIYDYLHSIDKEKLGQYADEVVYLYENYKQLSDQEKGKLIGYVIGKYGTEIFAGSAAFKAYSSYKKIRNANNICNLESMLKSSTSKECIISKGLQQSSERSQFFEKISIEWDKQSKHIPGKHNYETGKSIIYHKNIDQLLSENAGNGVSIRGTIGEPGYKEIVDFKETIGEWIGKDGSVLKTTRGTIHYSKQGAHIIPAHPTGKLSI